MKNKVFGLVCCGLVILALGIWGVTGMKQDAAGGVTRCLLIGCDRFVSMPGTEPASANNVDTMEALLADFLPEGTEIARQVNGPGSAEGFGKLAEETFRDAKAADTALIYLSTHGIIQNSEFRIQNSESGERENNSELRNRTTEYGMALLLSDGETEEGLTPEELRRVLEKIPGRKILILDACHSGAVIGEGREGENPFEGSGCLVLCSGSAEEDSWFWNTETDEYTGTGYFTAAMDRALRASDPEQIDPDGNGEVSLKELAERLREIHGASTVCWFPEESEEGLFRLPQDRKTGARLRGVSFGEAETDGDAVVLPIRFRAGERVRIMYQLVPWRNGKWDFEHAVRLPDREKTGLIRGLVNPGEKERKIRLTSGSLGEDGKALLQIICYTGSSMTPSVEAGTIIHSEFRIQNSELGKRRSRGEKSCPQRIKTCNCKISRLRSR